eukprot:2519300-Rhodomonas_salina.2
MPAHVTTRDHTRPFVTIRDHTRPHVIPTWGVVRLAARERCYGTCGSNIGSNALWTLDSHTHTHSLAPQHVSGTKGKLLSGACESNIGERVCDHHALDHRYLGVGLGDVGGGVAVVAAADPTPTGASASAARGETCSETNSHIATG